MVKSLSNSIARLKPIVGRRLLRVGDVCQKGSSVVSRAIEGWPTLERGQPHGEDAFTRRASDVMSRAR